jgi:hypothetical protein
MLLLTISKVNLKCKGRKNSQNENTKRVREKTSFGIFWQFSRQRKYKKPKPNKTKKKKRKGFEKKFLLATPKDNFKGKGRKNENAKGRKHLEKQE